VSRELFYLGLTHPNAPLNVREQLRTDRESQIALLSRLASLGEGRMVLATCERFEVYATMKHADANRCISFFAELCQLPAELVRQYARTLSESQAAGQLIRVAAGLESRILGERQILGQVRNAFQLALEQESLDAQLSMLARSAIRAGKRVRQETPLASGSRSIVTAAMDWLTDKHGGLADRAVGVVGSGRLASLVAAEVALRRPRRMVIAGRNEARAAELASRFGTECARISTLANVVARADVVITCTASPSYLLDRTMIGEDRANQLLLMDLSVPRNVDPSVVQLQGVQLGHVDEIVAYGLNAGACTGVVPGWDVIQQAENIVSEELSAFLQWRRERHVAPMITELFRDSGGASDKRALHARIIRLKAGVAV